MGVNVVIFGDSTLVDLREDTVKPENLFLGETAHGKDGNQVVGTFTIEDEINEQDSLIEQIQTALQGKAAGSGGSSGSDPVIRALTVTENGTYEAPAGVDGYSPVVVEVPVPDVPDPVDQATPVITVSDSGLITAKATQGAGVVAAGTKSATKQLATKGATTITPGASEQTVVSAGTFVTGDIKVAAAVNEDLEAILDEQEALIAELQDTLRRKAEGGNSDVEISLLTREITEYSNPTLTYLGAYALSGTSIVSLNLPALTTIAGFAFYECTKLTDVSFPSLTEVPYNGMRQFKGLVKADFHSLSKIGANAFYQCTNLEALVIRTNNICTLASGTVLTATKIQSGDGYIYVPSTLVGTYKSATNWSAFADQIRAIEDYPEICGG